MSFFILMILLDLHWISSILLGASFVMFPLDFHWHLTLQKLFVEIAVMFILDHFIFVDLTIHPSIITYIFVLALFCHFYIKFC